MDVKPTALWMAWDSQKKKTIGVNLMAATFSCREHNVTDCEAVLQHLLAFSLSHC